MHFLVLAITALFVQNVTAQQTLATSDYDGRWALQLVCDDVKSDKGLIKGYTYNFPLTVSGGKLTGGFKNPQDAGEINLVGTVQSNGEVFIQANGLTGKAEYNVGKVSEGVRYSYTLKGQFSERTGQARRVELRPCVANFTKL